MRTDAPFCVYMYQDNIVQAMALMLMLLYRMHGMWTPDGGYPSLSKFGRLQL